MQYLINLLNLKNTTPENAKEKSKAFSMLANMSIQDIKTQEILNKL